MGLCGSKESAAVPSSYSTSVKRQTIATARTRASGVGGSRKSSFQDTATTPMTRETHPDDVVKRVVESLARGKPLSLSVPKTKDIEKARLALKASLAEKHIPSIYLDKPEDLRRLLISPELKDPKGFPEQVPGPLRELVKQGGVIIVNENNWLSDLEQLNEVVEGNLFEGKEIEETLAVLTLLSRDKLWAINRSGPVVSRYQYCKQEEALKEANEVDIASYVDGRGHAVGEHVIELYGDDDWRTALQPQLGIKPDNEKENDQDGDWFLSADPFEVRGGKSETIVIRNAPINDPYFRDFYFEKINEGYQIALESGYSEAVIQTKLSNKTFPTVLPKEKTWVINETNYEEMLHQQPYVEDQKLKTKKGLLNRDNDNHAEPSNIFITGNLSESQWHRLMLSDRPLNICVAENVTVPSIYQDYIVSIATSDWLDSRGPVETVVCEDLGYQSYVMERDSDTEKGVYFVDVTPDMNRSDLIDRSTQATMGTLNFEYQESTLVSHLKMGYDVVFRGLECNPRLQAELDTLFSSPSPYLMVNGERQELKDLSPNNSKIYVFAPRKIQEHNLSLERSLYRQFITALEKDFPGIDKLVGKLYKLSQVLHRKNLIPVGQNPAFSFNKVKHIASQIQAIQKQHRISFDEALSQALLEPEGKILKDLLLIDMKKDKSAYHFIKAQVRSIFSKENVLSYDPVRIKQYLTDCLRAEDVKSQLWRFTNAFSPELIRHCTHDTSSKALDESKVEQNIMSLLAHICDQNAMDDKKHLFDEVSHRDKANWGHQRIMAHQKSRVEDRSPGILRKAKQALVAGSGLFLKGSPGAGKTYLIDRLVGELGGTRFDAHIEDEGTSEFKDAIKRWAKGELGGKTVSGRKILVIDEANLAKPNFFRFLEGLVSANNGKLKTISIDGETFHLGDDHKIIVTGNEDHFAGRHVHETFRDSFTPILFRSLKPEFLKQKVIDPVLGKVKRLRQSDKHRITESLLKIHEKFSIHYPEIATSPRNLEQALSYILAYRNVDRGLSLDLLIAKSLQDVYGGQLSFDEQAAFSVVIRRELGLDLAEPLASLGHVTDSQLKQVGIACIPASQKLADQVNTFLEVENWKKKSKFEEADGVLGQKALLIEGPPGVGKDTIVEKVLESRGEQYVRINTCKDQEFLKKQIVEAMQQGKAVILSEANMLQSNILEGMLNGILTGDATKGVQAKPGFKLIVTMNPETDAGREKLSEAFLNRFTLIKTREHNKTELKQLAYHFSQGQVANERISELLAHHNAILDDLKQKGSNVLPTARQLRESIETLRALPHASIDELIESHYTFYVDLQNSAAQKGSNKGREASAKLTQVNALLRWYWPKGSIPPKVVLFDKMGEGIQYDKETHQLIFGETASLEEVERTIRQSIARLRTSGQDQKQPAVNQKASLNARNKLTSGVGTQNIEGNLGKITSSVDLAITYLADGFFDLNRNKITNFQAKHVRSVASKKPQNRIVLDDTLVVSPQLLLVPKGCKPASFSINGASIDTQFVRKPDGNWYADLSGVQLNNEKSDIAYEYIEDPLFVDASPSVQKPAAQPVSLQADPSLAGLVEQLKNDRAGTSYVIQALTKYLKDNLEYSDEFAFHYEGKERLTDRTIALLECKKGVCAEFADALALILSDHFQVPTRLVAGYVSNSDGDIPAQSHRWVEWWDAAQSKWLVADPTPASSLPGARPAADEAKPKRAKLGAPLSKDKLSELISPRWGPDAKHRREALKNFLLNDPMFSIQPQQRLESYTARGTQVAVEQIAKSVPEIYKTSQLSDARKLRPIYAAQMPKLEVHDIASSFEDDEFLFWYDLISLVEVFAVMDQSTKPNGGSGYSFLSSDYLLKEFGKGEYERADSTAAFIIAHALYSQPHETDHRPLADVKKLLETEKDCLIISDENLQEVLTKARSFYRAYRDDIGLTDEELQTVGFAMSI